MSWEGPYRIGDYLGGVAHRPSQRPPEKAGVYVVSENPWEGLPTAVSKLLYVGQAVYLRYQIGRLLCDLLGFTGDTSFSEEAYQHKGGHLLWSQYCLPHQQEPARLYLGWCSECLCIACAETKLLNLMSTGPRRVKNCTTHSLALDLWQNTTGLPVTLNFNGGH